MTHPHKIKGSSFERSALTAIQDEGFHAYRTFNAGIAEDVGDIHVRGRVDVVLQCKAVKRWEPSSFILDAKTQAMRASTTILDDPIGAVVIKRIGKSDPLHAYVLLELGDLLRLVAE
jgi:hypothetical protein